MRDFLPQTQPWSWPRTIMVLVICSAFGWLIDDQSPRNIPYALLTGAILDAAWYAHFRHLQTKAFRVFKTYALQEAWMSSARFRTMMTETAFVALFEDCLSKPSWRQDMVDLLVDCSFECRRDPFGDPPGLRCYLKLRYPLHWTSEQRIGALIVFIGAVPNTKMWTVREEGDALKIETGLFPLEDLAHQASQLPLGAQEFWSVFQHDLSRLLDLEACLPPPKFTTGLNATVELAVPCVLPLSDGSFLHIAENESGKLTATAEKAGVPGSVLEYNDASALWEVWRNAVVVEKRDGSYVVNVPDTALSPAERRSMSDRTSNKPD